MRRATQNPKSHIISCRLSSEEFQTLAEIAQQTGCNISNLLRRSLDLQIAGSEKNATAGN